MDFEWGKKLSRILLAGMIMMLVKLNIKFTDLSTKRVREVMRRWHLNHRIRFCTWGIMSIKIYVVAMWIGITSTIGTLLIIAVLEYYEIFDLFITNIIVICIWCGWLRFVSYENYKHKVKMCVMRRFNWWRFIELKQWIQVMVYMIYFLRSHFYMRK